MSSEAQTDEDDRIEQLEARVEELEAQDSLTSGTVPISRRGLLQGGAALGIGALGGSVLGGGNSGRVAAQTASGQVGTDSDRVDVFGNVVDASTYLQDGEEFSAGADGEDISPASVSTDEINTVVHVHGGDELTNRTVNEDALYRLEQGTVTFSDNIANDQTIIVEGAGKNETTLKATNGQHLLYREYDDLSDKRLVFRDLTLDFDNLSGNDTDFIRIPGTIGEVVFDSVEVKNLDLSNFDTGGFIGLQNNVFGEVCIIGETVFRWDTITNRPADGTGDNFHILDSGGASVNRLTVAQSVRHVCPTDDPDALGFEELRGYNIPVNDTAIIDGTFENWDQYATYLECNSEEGIVDIRASATNVGSADIFRAGSTVSGGGVIKFGGAVSGLAGGGDRGYIVQSASTPAAVVLNNPVVNVGLVPIQIQAGELISGTITIKDSGHPDGDSRPAVQIDDNDGSIGQVNLTVNIRNDTTERSLDPAIELSENNGGWSDATHVIEGVARGYETTQVDDQTDSGTTINTNRLFG